MTTAGDGSAVTARPRDLTLLCNAGASFLFIDIRAMLDEVE
jgi:hypothetical protein